MKEKKPVGAPKRYENKTTISHTIEYDVLIELNRLAHFAKTRTDIINDAILAHLKEEHDIEFPNLNK